MNKPASDKQIALITRLIGEKNVPMTDPMFVDTIAYDVILAVQSGRPVTVRDASFTIDAMFRMPRATAVAAHAPADTDTQTGEGIYVLDGDIIKVVKARSTGNLYAKRLVLSAPRITAEGTEVDADFVYAPGVIRHLTPSMQMSVDAARAFAVQHGLCAACGRKLRAAKSVEAGIGPVCIKKFAPVAPAAPVGDVGNDAEAALATFEFEMAGVSA